MSPSRFTDTGPLLGEHAPLGPLTLEDRQRLVAERGVVLRLLLDQAFSDLLDVHDLHPYGFRGDDPVSEAVEWAITFFASERFKPEKLRERTTRLFTRPELWLSLKVGRRAWGARQGRRRQALDLEQREHTPPSQARARQDRALDALRRDMGAALGALRAHTCASLVTHWLEASERLRATLFDWEAPTTPQDEDLSKGKRSFIRHDAQFRYICLLIDLLDDSSADEAHRAVLKISFSPCPDARPYRVPESVAAEAWPQPITPRALLKLRKQGLRELLSHALQAAERAAHTPDARLRALVLRHGLSKTTAHAYKLHEDAGLLDRLDALPKPEVSG